MNASQFNPLQRHSVVVRSPAAWLTWVYLHQTRTRVLLMWEVLQCAPSTAHAVVGYWLETLIGMVVFGGLVFYDADYKIKRCSYVT